MKNIIYSKYSNERADKFKIRTDIVQDLNGIRFVQKKALTEEANEHINNIYVNYNLLSEMYKDSPLHIGKCNKIEAGLEFEYIVGKTFEEELDELLFNKNYMKIFERIREYIDIIGSGIEKEKFKKTEKFTKVFGTVNLPLSLKAARINNIDLIFSNIIIGDRWNIIDYEWTFNFPIPFNYIIYRAIAIYIGESSKRNKLTELGLYKMLGITDDEIIEYDNMERNFYDYVIEGHIPLNHMYNKFSKNNVEVVKFIEKKQIDFFKNIVQIFYNYGKGFSEENSYKIHPTFNEEGKIAIEIDVDPKVTQVRIDPSNSKSIVNIESIVGYTTTYYPINYYTNGILLNDRTTIFTNDDPQIVLFDMKDGTNKIQIIFSIQIISKNITIGLCEFINKKENEIKEKENEIREKENIINNKNQYIKEIESCRIWKCLKGVKKIIRR